MLREYMRSLGYSDDSIEKMLTSRYLKNFQEETLYKHVKEDYGYLKKLGFKENEILKITQAFPNIFSFKATKIELKVDNLLELGYPKSTILKMIKIAPPLIGYGVENVRSKIEYLKSLGCTKEETLKMTSVLPYLFGINIRYITKRIDDLQALGYTREQIIQMIKIFPRLLTYNIENIKEKVEFLKSIKIDFVILKSPQKLMQSIDLTYARYMFFKSRNIKIDKSNCYYLFLGHQTFKNQYAVNTKYLLDKYNYQKYLMVKASYQKYKEKSKNGVSI